MHISAMVPLYGPAGTSRAFPQRIARTLVGQEHAPTETSRPLSPSQTPVVVCKVSGPPVLRYASHWVWTPPCFATHMSSGYSRRALLAIGLRWPSCITCPRPILEDCRHLETHNLGHHRHRPTVRNYTNYNGHQQLHQPAKPHRHQHHPITHHHGRGTLQVHVSCGVFPPCASPTKAPFSRSPLWAHPGEGGRESKGDQPKTWGFRFVLGSTVSTPDVQHATKQSGVDEMCTERQLCLRQTYTEDSVTSCHNHVSHLPVPDELPT